MTSRTTSPAALLASLALVALLQGCSGSDSSSGSESGSAADDTPPTLSSRLLEQEVRSQLEEEVGREPEEVTCPGDLVGVVDQQVRCALSDSGTELGVTLTVTSVEGNDVKFDIQVDDAAG